MSRFSLSACSSRLEILALLRFGNNGPDNGCDGETGVVAFGTGDATVCARGRRDIELSLVRLFRGAVCEECEEVSVGGGGRGIEGGLKGLSVNNWEDLKLGDKGICEFSVVLYDIVATVRLFCEREDVFRAEVCSVSDAPRGASRLLIADDAGFLELPIEVLEVLAVVEASENCESDSDEVLCTEDLGNGSCGIVGVRGVWDGVESWSLLASGWESRGIVFCRGRVKRSP
jgi:hypothetical protein